MKDTVRSVQLEEINDRKWFNVDKFCNPHITIDFVELI